ncbi:MAG TPA: phosphatase PAP2 family protein [Candidatus Moranbacteria bacterium]|nr:phosphatase PAP2 family protein [Candidatus Moranbacteria bacterium]
MSEFEKRVVIMFAKPYSRALDNFSALISSVPLLFVFWIAVSMSILISDLVKGTFVILGLAIVFIEHFIISEGIFKWGGYKFSLKRLRPYVAYPKLIKPVGRKFQDSSLPSSHLASMVGGLVVLVFFYNFIWPIAIFLTLLLAWSRIRNGMHYPSDILIGIALGLTYGYLALEIINFLF